MLICDESIPVTLNVQPEPKSCQMVKFRFRFPNWIYLIFQKQAHRLELKWLFFQNSPGFVIDFGSSWLYRSWSNVLKWEHGDRTILILIFIFSFFWLKLSNTLGLTTHVRNVLQFVTWCFSLSLSPALPEIYVTLMSLKQWSSKTYYNTLHIQCTPNRFSIWQHDWDT